MVPLGERVFSHAANSQTQNALLLCYMYTIYFVKKREPSGNDPESRKQPPDHPPALDI